VCLGVTYPGEAGYGGGSLTRKNGRAEGPKPGDAASRDKIGLDKIERRSKNLRLRLLRTTNTPNPSRRSRPEGPQPLRRCLFGGETLQL
jgi:hypothetical protein